MAKKKKKVGRRSKKEKGRTEGEREEEEKKETGPEREETGDSMVEHLPISDRFNFHP